MSTDANDKLAVRILNKAFEFGADLAGFTNIASLKESPSHKIYPNLPDYAGVGTGRVHIHEKSTITKKNIVWPQGAKTVLVIALSHPETAPSLDLWRDPFFGCTKGNLQLIKIINEIIKWLGESQDLKCRQIPYVIEQGGIFLKDAAVLAGIGIIGKNNMLVTPQFGPRVRLRAMTLPINFPSTGLLNFDPCTDCGSLCRKPCPSGAFNKTIFSSVEYNQTQLPAKDGKYARQTCNIEMEQNIKNARHIPIEEKDDSMRVVLYCRVCEFACPIGQNY